MSPSHPKAKGGAAMPPDDAPVKARPDAHQDATLPGRNSTDTSLDMDMQAPAPWNDSRAKTLGLRLMERARHSVATHRDFRTIRRADRVWEELAPGVTEAHLHSTDQARATLVRLQPGSSLPWPAGTAGQEILVVQGRVHAHPAGQQPVVLEPHALALRGAADAGELLAVDAPALLYVRHLQTPPDALANPERQWWALPRAPLHTVAAAGRRWRPTFPGVEVLPMWGTADITSMLVRFAPGASVPDHPHAAHEDCLMLEGEMFLGDVLLQHGDYQLAPAGGGHFGETSDVGCTFFFHGAIDPVLVAPPRG